MSQLCWECNNYSWSHNLTVLCRMLVLFCFLSGDNVYLRSDQADPYVARIDRIWTDKE